MQLRIKLSTPEPYFLGGERIFEIGNANLHYFIRSMQVPSQTTLFGILRYLGIEKINENVKLDKDDIKNIGSQSFQFKCSSDIRQDITFGKIQEISPLYLIDENENYYIKTPFDHKVRNDTKDAVQYDPFSDYIQSAIGTEIFPTDYKAKDGIADSWMCITPECRESKSSEYKRTRSDLFGSKVRVGINKQRSKKAFIKKEYVYLKERGFSFVFFAKVDDDFKYVKERYVKPGFYAEVTEMDEPEIPSDIFQNHNRRIIYAQSDMFLSPEDADEVYDNCDFVCVQIKNFRGRVTNYDEKRIQDRYKKYDEIFSLIQAGSMFVLKTTADLERVKAIIENKHMQKAGLNRIVIGGKQ